MSCSIFFHFDQPIQLVNSLTSLSLKANEIGDTGAISIAKMLEVNTSLQELDLSDNFIGDSGVQELTKSLAKNTTLQRLNISSNRFSKIEGGVLRTSFSSFVGNLIPAKKLTSLKFYPT